MLYRPQAAYALSPAGEWLLLLQRQRAERGQESSSSRTPLQRLVLQLQTSPELRVDRISTYTPTQQGAIRGGETQPTWRVFFPAFSSSFWMHRSMQCPSVSPSSSFSRCQPM